jgi:alkanesulfonate monooxygenase SsuD/methylene tetrahydromethanopterin reductase-like flavin-dependent oxidoreductase (luciferase family)
MRRHAPKRQENVMPLIGLDPEQVRIMAQTLRTGAEDATRIQQTVTAAVEAAPWVGPDRDQFVADWQTQSQQLTVIATTLQDTATRADQNIAAQEQTSAT